MSKKAKKEDYNDDPVTYCSRCYSLNIKQDDAVGFDFCGECGCTDFSTTDVFTWEKLFKNRYGHDFVEASHDFRKSPVFTMSLDRLKAMVFKDECWKELCRAMYPAFPEGISKADSVVLLFAKIIQDNRLDELRMELINKNYKK